MSWSTLIELARDNGGVVLVPQAARAAGLDPRLVKRRAARDGWWCPYPNVVGLPGTPVDPRARALAAVCHLRGHTVDGASALVAVTRWTAAHLYGVQRSAPSRAQVLIAARRHLDPRAGVEIVRSRDLTVHDIRDVDHVPIVTATRLLRDIAPVCEVARLRALTIDLLQRRHLTLDEAHAALAAWPTFAGRSRIRQVLAELGAAGRTDSPLELEIRRGLNDAGVPLDRDQVPVPLVRGGSMNLDVGILAICFAVDVDSMAHHSSREDLTNDARRTNAVAEAPDDWRVLRATWDILHDDWPAFVAQVREVVAAQSRRHLGIPWPRPSDLRR
jgi:hypothetical protein